MTIRHLKVFVCVCRHSSITRAAEEMMVAQPAISKTIAELEDYYGVSLFRRIKHRLTLTPEGCDLLIKAKQVINSFDEFEKTAFSKKYNVSVLIGSSLTIGKTVMPELIKRVKSAFPEADLRFKISRTSEIENRISEGDMDFAFIEGNPSSSVFSAEAVAQDRILAVAARGYRTDGQLTEENIGKYDLILRERGSASRDYFDSILTLRHVSITPLIESASNQAIISAAVNGLGIAILPQRIVSEYIKNGSLVIVDTDLFDMPRTTFMILRKDSVFNEKKEHIISFCRSEFKKIFSDTESQPAQPA